jgi:tripartite-type tricarboxylate transporter receptor subunit TctC
LRSENYQLLRLPALSRIARAQAHPSRPVRIIVPFPAGLATDTVARLMGQSSSGSVSHVFGERFKTMTGINLVHVPYRGGYVSDLLSGQVQVAIGTISTNIQYIRGGMLRALAVTTATRSDVLPDIPTLAEFVPGYEGANGMGSVRRKTHPLR